MSDDNVTTLVVPPRRSHHKYKRYSITITYIPIDKEFHWTFHHTTAVSFGGREASAELAMLAAHKEIDSLIDTIEEREHERPIND